MSNEIEAFYDDGNYLAGKSTTIILGKTNILKSITGLLNSRVCSFFVNSSYHSLKMAGGYINIGTEILKSIPMPTIPEDIRIRLATYVDKILAITKDADYLDNPVKQAQVREYEKQIDRMVYDLYGLTEEEIKIVEGETK